MSEQLIQGSKRCNICLETKALADFHKLSKSKDGRQLRCKACACAATRDWGRRNKARTSANHKEYFQTHKERLTKKSAAWAKEHPNRMLEYSRKSWAKHRDKRNDKKREYRASTKDKQKEYYRQYHASRPGLKAAWDAARRSAEKNAMPPWAEKKAIAAIYREARQRSAETGIQWDVDHIIPLQHELVCGLHIAANLQLLPAIENQRKNNRFSNN